MHCDSGRPAAAAEEIKSSRYAGDLRNDATVRQLMAGSLPVDRVADYQLVADDPLNLDAKEVLEKSAVPLRRSLSMTAVATAHS